MFIRRLSYRLKPEHGTEAEHSKMRKELIEAFKDVEGCRRRLVADKSEP